MEKLSSILAPYLNANTLQAIINQVTPLLVTGWYRTYFPDGPVRNSLTYATIIGASRIASNASVVDRDSTSPVRARPGLQKILGEVPAIKNYTYLKEVDVRMILEMQELNQLNGGRLDDVFNLVFNDIKYISDGIENRMDDFVAQGLSTGVINIDDQNNPDGFVQGGYIDCFLPSNNKLVSAADWSNNATNILIDIQTTVQTAKRRGVTFSKIFVPILLWYSLLNNTSVQNFIKGYYNPGSNAVFAVTLETLNIALKANLLPQIELVDFTQMVEADGKQTAYNPWDSVSVTFVPTGNLGIIHNARAIEDGLRPAANVQYSKTGNTLISRWSSNEPFREYTKGERNAFPGLESINSVYIMHTDTSSW